MKWSRYNIFYDKDDKSCILYNYATDSIIFLLTELRIIIESCGNNIDLLQNIHPELYNELAKKEFIVDENLDEVENVICRINDKLNSLETFKLTINPTLDCNLKCWYCYENHIERSKIDPKSFEGIKNLLSKKISNKNLKKIELSFFGGEPLFRTKEIVLSIISYAKGLCENYKKDFNLYFITNATLLDSKFVKEITKLCSTISIQVPFDGGKEEHDKVKRFKSLKGTYDLVLKNIIVALENGINVNIRCNYSSTTNLDSFKELIFDVNEKASKYKGQINFGMQQVWQSPFDSNLNKKLSEIRTFLINNNFNNNLTSIGAVSTPCYADFANSLVINYNGDIFKCTARDFIPKNRVGVLEISGDVTFNESYSKRLSQRFNADCFNCKILPICTVCSQKRYEANDINKCPISITEQDKDNQIYYRLQSLSYQYS